MPDVLSDIISTIELRSTLDFRAEPTAPFSIAVPEDSNVIRFHVANAGPCYVGLESGEHAMMQAGDLVLVSRGAAHVLADVPSERPEALADVLSAARFDGSGPMEFGRRRAGDVAGVRAFQLRTRSHASHRGLAACAGSFKGRFRSPLRVARAIAGLHGSRNEGPVGGVGRGRQEGFRDSDPCSSCEVHQSAGRPAAALAALADPQIGRALSAIHEHPAVEWTVEELAQRAAMSRSIFADRFRETLGMTPSRYLASWRMHKARALLSERKRAFEEIAWEVGYASEPSFNRTFKEQFGAPPGRYRRAATREEPG